MAENSTAVTIVTATDGDLPAAARRIRSSGARHGPVHDRCFKRHIELCVRSQSRVAYGFGLKRDLRSHRAIIGWPALIDIQTLNVTITDVDEFDVTNPVDSNAVPNSVNENAVNGTAVGITASASDADATTNTVTYSLTDSASGRFAIDPSTGVVTVAGAESIGRGRCVQHYGPSDFSRWFDGRSSLHDQRKRHKRIQCDDAGGYRRGNQCSR